MRCALVGLERGRGASPSASPTILTSSSSGSEVRLPFASFAFLHDARAVGLSQPFDQTAEQLEWAFITAASGTKDGRFKAAVVLLVGVGSFLSEDARIFEQYSQDIARWKNGRGRM
jgi:hypothetical protein